MLLAGLGLAISVEMRYIWFIIEWIPINICFLFFCISFKFPLLRLYWTPWKRLLEKIYWFGFYIEKLLLDETIKFNLPALA